MCGFSSLLLKMLLLCVFLLLCMAFIPLACQIEQRATIKVLQKAGHTPIQIWRGLSQVFQGDALSKTQVRQWFNRFKEGDMSTTTADKPRPGRPNLCRRKVARVQNALQTDGRLSIQEIIDQTGISKTSVHRILKKDLRMSKLSAKFVPRILTQEQKTHRKTLCEQNLAALRADKDMLEEVITADESWLSLFEPDTKQDSAQWMRKGSVRPQKARHLRATRKTCWFSFLTLQDQYMWNSSLRVRQ